VPAICQAKIHFGINGRFAREHDFHFAGTIFIADRKQADQPAATVALVGACAGGARSGELTSSRPSSPREAAIGPPVVCVLAVYNTFSISAMICSSLSLNWLLQISDSNRVRYSDAIA